MKIQFSHQRPSARAFTLIELLTVISIIALLAAAAFAGYGKIVESARKKAAQVMAMTLTQAIEQFYADYSRLPKPTSGGDDADATSDTSQTEGLVKILLAKEGEGEGETRQNTRSTDYLDGFPQAKPSKDGVSNPTEGLVYEEDKFEIFDAWGNYFKVKLDLDYDNELENPNVEEGQTTKLLRKRVLIWSVGKDKLEETWDDNVKSWQ